MKHLFFILMAMFILASCENLGNSNQEISQQQEQLMNEANRQLGMPAITNFQERKLAKMIFELRDREDLVCYAYIVNHMTGKLVFLGKCIGYGLPYSTQYTNPIQVVNRYGNAAKAVNVEIATIPQADPNGLFMPEGLSATWLMMIDPDTNEPRPVYLEPEIIVSPFKLKIG